MIRLLNNPASFLTNKRLYYFLLFVYFGFMTIPQWFRPFSPQFLVWLSALPFVFIALIMIGIWGAAGILQANRRRLQSKSKHIVFTQISGIGFLLFVVFMAIAYKTHFLYNHQKFNSEIWKDTDSARYVSYDLSPRQRMLDDVVENILPGSTKDKIEKLFGESTNTGHYSSSERDLIYVLGAERGLGVDSEWLHIWFDNSGNFERYDIIID